MTEGMTEEQILQEYRISREQYDLMVKTLCNIWESAKEALYMIVSAFIEASKSITDLTQEYEYLPVTEERRRSHVRRWTIWRRRKKSLK